MITLRKSSERGETKLNWLESYHSFSFADYYDLENMGFGTLRVLNDDTIQPEKGFGAHHHRDREIITIILSGELSHKDNIGNSSIIRENEVQVMSAGTGVVHAEYNDSKKITKLLQIWIEPRERNLIPRYDQKEFNPNELKGQFKEVVSGEKSEGTLFINQDANLLLGNFGEGKEINYEMQQERKVYLFMIEGEAEIMGKKLGKKDAAMIEKESLIKIKSNSESKILIIDMK
jgi:hypothetical protein